MKALGLHTGADLKQLTEKELVSRFGKIGAFYFNIVRGIDNRLVQPNRETKSIGAEDTFSQDLTALEDMAAELDALAKVVEDRLERHGLKGRTVTVKIKYHDFKISTRSRSFAEPVADGQTIAATAKALLAEADLTNAKVRLLGITLSNFGERKPIGYEPDRQLELF